jgi:hypothetical protein
LAWEIPNNAGRALSADAIEPSFSRGLGGIGVKICHVKICYVNMTRRRSISS